MLSLPVRGGRPAAGCTGARVVDPFARWEKNIAAIEKRLKADPPKPAVFFAGSSSIVLWDLKNGFRTRITSTSGLAVPSSRTARASRAYPDTPPSRHDHLLRRRQRYRPEPNPGPGAQ